MLKHARIILIFLVLLTIPTVIQPVCGQTSLDNSSVPVWSDLIGERKTVVSCSEDGGYVVAGSDTGVLRMYDRCGTRLWEIQHPGKAVRSLAISDNGDLTGAVFVDERGPSSYAGGEALVFNRTGDVLWNYADDPTVEQIVFSGDGNQVYVSGSSQLYSFSREGTLIAKNTSTGRTWALDAARDGSYAVAGSKITGNRLDAMQNDGNLAWNVSTKNGFGSVDVSPDDGYVAAAGYSHLYLLDRNGTLLWQYTGSSEFTSVAVATDGGYTVAGSQYYAWLFNRTGSLLWKHKFEGFVNDVGISDDAKSIVAGSSRGIYVFDREGNVLWNYGTPKAIQSLSIAHDVEYFTAGTTDTVYVFNQWGNTTCDNETNIPVMNTSPHFTDTRPVQQPTTKKSPLLNGLAILGICCVVVFNRGKGEFRSCRGKERE